MGSESQGATKIKSALADARTYSSMKMMTLDMHMNAMNQVLCVSPSFLSNVMTKSTSRLTGVYMTNNSCQESVLEDSLCKKEEQYDSEFQSEHDEWPGTENQWCFQLDLSYHYAIGLVLLGFMVRWDSTVISATCQFAIFIAPVDSEAATRHVYLDQVYRFWFDEWCLITTIPQTTCTSTLETNKPRLAVRSSPHLRLLREHHLLFQ